MIRAYAENYLSHARNNLGRMLDVGVNHLRCPLKKFYQHFLAVSLSRRFAGGEPDALVGHSGIELAFEVLPEVLQNGTASHRHFLLEATPEYWTGWALAYYQWQTSLSFAEINNYISIEKIRALYSPYHEMDISQFVDHLNERIRGAKYLTNLKLLRTRSGLSQSQLASVSGVPLRTIQQYEQRQKNINKAQAEYVFMLSRSLSCNPEDLLEKV